MKAIMLMFDSLNRHMLPPYGCDWTHAPNFARLGQRTVVFDRSYVCSMPCMPARRDLLTGRPNFLHRSWGPLEPFDDAVPAMLAKAGVHTHLSTDHYHYWETGGATYHTTFSTFDFHRGQEGDLWKGVVGSVKPPANAAGQNAMRGQDWVNRQFMRHEHEMSQPQTIAAGLDFVRRNADKDRWFVQMETFDPHEPFFSHRKYKDLYAEHYRGYRGPFLDWPKYAPVTEPREVVEHVRYEYAALLSMCDAYLGEVLDVMDELDLWKDTLLMVWTDHGFLLGEHECWAKIWMPFYEEVAHTPFFVWDPRCGKAGERRQSLVQPSIDLGPTLLDFFGVEATPHMRGKCLRDVVAADRPVREAAMFGVHGGQVNVTDGRHVYMRGPAKPENTPLFNYTLMPAHMRTMFAPEELAKATLAPPFSFTKGCPLLKIPAGGWSGRNPDLARTYLWDVQADPQQKQPLQDAAVEQRMIAHLTRLMAECDAPVEQYERLGLSRS